MSIYLSPFNTRQWTPFNIPSIGFWVDASDINTITFNGSNVSQWKDKSGNNRHATQSTPVNQPAYTTNGLNGKPVLTFNGSSSFLNVPTAILTGQNWTFIAVFTLGANTSQPYARLASAVRSTASGGTGADYDDHASWVILNRNVTDNNIRSHNVTSGVNIVLDTPYIVRVTRNTEANALALNGDTPLTNTTVLNPLNTTAGMRIGRSINPRYEANEHWTGILAEMILVQNLSTTDIQKLEGYLGHKWGLAIYLPSNHPYKNSYPSI